MAASPFRARPRTPNPTAPTGADPALRYEGLLLHPGRAPLQVWTILSGPAAGASFGVDVTTESLQAEAEKTAARFCKGSGARGPP